MAKSFIIKLIVLTLLVTQTAIAQTSAAQQDFAFFATLSDGKQSLRQFELPYQVLAGLERQDYGDLRIFNRQNQAVPFSIRQSEAQTYQNKNSYALRFFRLGSHNNQHGGLQIEFGENSTRFNFNADTDNEESNYLLIENQHQADDLQAIKLDWQQLDNDFSIKVKLESSDDLQSWQAVNDSITLYDLKYAGALLLQNTLTLPADNHAKYLRLSFKPSNTFTLQIEKITGEYRHTTLVERENQESFALEMGETSNEWLFNTGSFVPVSKIEFKIPAVGLFYQGSLYSKNDDSSHHSTQIKPHAINLKREVKQVFQGDANLQTAQKNAWRYQSEVTQYRLLTASGEITSESVSLYPVKDRQWKVILQQPVALLPEQIPTVNIAWNPVIVTFLAQGDPPYRLFFGNANIAPLNAVLPPIFNDKDVETIDVQTVQAVEKPVIAKEQPISASAAEKINWQKTLLWFLLCFGVLLMAVMAYQLYLRMNR